MATTNEVVILLMITNLASSSNAKYFTVDKHFNGEIIFSTKTTINDKTFTDKLTPRLTYSENARDAEIKLTANVNPNQKSVAHSSTFDSEDYGNDEVLGWIIPSDIQAAENNMVHTQHQVSSTSSSTSSPSSSSSSLGETSKTSSREKRSTFQNDNDVKRSKGNQKQITEATSTTTTSKTMLMSTSKAYYDKSASRDLRLSQTDNRNEEMSLADSAKLITPNPNGFKTISPQVTAKSQQSSSVISTISRSVLSEHKTAGQDDFHSPNTSTTNTQFNQSNGPRASQFFGHYPFHDMDDRQRQLWLEHLRKEGRGSLSVEGTFLWTCGMIGTIANAAVFLTAAISKYFRKPLHIMVSSLALLDLYVTFLYIPSYTYFLVERNRDLDDNKQWSESAFSYCNFTRGMFLFSASLGITIQNFIALYLFVMTCSKDLAGKIFTTKNTIIYIASACFGNVIMLFTPTLFGYPRVDFYPNGHLCSPLTHERVGDWQLSNFRVLYHCVILTVHISELLLICFFVINIFLAVVRGKLVRIKYGRKDKMANMNYSRAIHLTVVVFSSFMLLWLPLYIINFVDPNHDVIPDAVHHLVFDLLLLKSCVNPLIYIYAIKTLRFELRLLCMCKFTAEDRRKALTPPKKTTTSYNGPSDIATSSYGF